MVIGRRFWGRCIYIYISLSLTLVLGLQDKIGNFVQGKEFDALRINLEAPNSPVDVFPTDGIEDLLQKFIYLGEWKQSQLRFDIYWCSMIMAWYMIAVTIPTLYSQEMTGTLWLSMWLERILLRVDVFKNMHRLITIKITLYCGVKRSPQRKYQSLSGSLGAHWDEDSIYLCIMVIASDNVEFRLFARTMWWCGSQP